MAPDVDLLREILLILELRQVSPRATIIILTEVEAINLDCSIEHIEQGLNILLERDYIEGPGQDDEGSWLFRKLTRKGIEFVRRTRHPRDWEQMKRHFANQALALDI